MEKTKRNNAYANILKYTGIFGGVQALNIVVALVRNKLVAVLLALWVWDLLPYSTPQSVSLATLPTLALA